MTLTNDNTLYETAEDGNPVLRTKVIGSEESQTNIIGTLPIQYDAYTLLNDMLKQMKIMNLHLALITDNFIGNKDVEV
jgi:hypothetical protein